ncbi:MAG: hypothetical protein HYX63_09335 [Gammaproteobacteria bacterium]|nr:hypothetical protein [Gammaproteobacteria bacterium]
MIFASLHFQWFATIENGGTSLCRGKLCLLQSFPKYSKIFLSLRELFREEARIAGSTMRLCLEASRGAARKYVRFLTDAILVSEPCPD